MNASRFAQISSPWLPTQPSAEARLRVFCFPYAGGGPAVFREWGTYFEGTGLQLCPISCPGREKRIKEVPLESMKLLADGAFEAMLPYLAKPFALLGLCFGANLAFETALRCRDAGFVPEGMLISGNRAPHLPSQDNIASMSDEKFLGHLRCLGFIPQIIFDTPDLLELFLPTLRADFLVDASYVYNGTMTPFTFPLALFVGKHDSSTPELSVHAWRAYTTGPFVSREFEGDHLFFALYRDAYLESIKKELLAMIAPLSVTQLS